MSEPVAAYRRGGSGHNWEGTTSRFLYQENSFWPRASFLEEGKEKAHLRERERERNLALFSMQCNYVPAFSPCYSFKPNV